MKIDLHLHTAAYSACSRLDPREAIRVAAARGLDGLAFTEHGLLWPEPAFREMADFAAGNGILLLPGLEYRCYNRGMSVGDMLVFGLEEAPAPRLAPAALIGVVHEAGGVVIPAHPLRARLSLDPEAWGLPFDAIEAANGNQTAEENAASWRLGKKLSLPMVGGSDAHDATAVGLFRTVFRTTLGGIDDLLRAIRTGGCFPAQAAPTEMGEAG